MVCSWMRTRRPPLRMARHGIYATRPRTRLSRPSCSDRRHDRSYQERTQMSSVSPTALGGFVLGGLAVVVAAILFFGGGDVFAPKTKAVAFFDGSVGGLAPGAAVTYRGVRVGSVSSVSVLVDPTELKARVPVYLQLESE